MKEMVWH